MNVYLIRHETEISEFKNRYIYERIKMFVNRIVTGFRGFYRNFLVSTLWKQAEPQIYVIKGKILGNEGKAQTLYNLVLNSGANNVFAVVRYNGGHNRGGNLVTSGGNHLCLSQLNSAVSLGVMTVIAGDDALLDPGKIIHEADELAGILGKSREAILDNNTKIDGKTGLITNLHIMLNRMEEILNGHGTIGVGIYQAAQDKNNPNRLTFDDLFDENRLKAKVPQIVREKITAAMILIKSKTDGHLAKELKAEFELACGS